MAIGPMDGETKAVTSTAAAIHAAGADTYVNRITIQANRNNTGIVSIGGANTQTLTLLAGEAVDVFPGLSSNVWAKTSRVDAGDTINFIIYPRNS